MVDGELSAKQDEILQLMATYDDGWSYLRREETGEEGLMPTDYFEMIEDPQQSTPQIDIATTTTSSYSPVSTSVSTPTNVDDSSSGGGIKIKRKDVVSVNFGNYKTPTGPPKYNKNEAIKILMVQMNRALKRKKLKDFFNTTKEYKPLKKRNELIREFVQTEESYVGSLRLFVNTFAKPVKQNTNLLSEKKAKIIFSNIEQILGINEMLYASITAAMLKWPNKNEFGETINKMMPFFKSYVSFINNYDNAFDMLEHTEKKKGKFYNFLQEEYAKLPPNSHKLNSLLIMPVQRIPRYKMLIESILQNTPQDHVEYKHFESALQNISDIAKFVNERKRQEDDNNVIYTELKKSLKNTYKSLVKPTRRFIKEYSFKLKIKDSKDKDDFRGFIFSDVLILCQEQNKSSLFKKQNVYFMFFSFTKVLKSTTSNEIPIRYLTNGKEIDFTLFTTNEEDCKNLIELFNERINSIAESQSYKNLKLDKDSFSVGSERIQFAEKRNEAIDVIDKDFKNYQLVEKKLKKLDQSLLQHEQELRRLVETIAKEKEEKKLTIKELENIESEQNDYQNQLKKYLDEVKSRDEILYDSLLRNEDEDFNIVFGESTCHQLDLNVILKNMKLVNNRYTQTSSSIPHLDLDGIQKEIQRVDSQQNNRLSMSNIDTDSSSSDLSTPTSSFSDLTSNSTIFNDSFSNLTTSSGHASLPKKILPPPMKQMGTPTTSGNNNSAIHEQHHQKRPTPPPRPTGLDLKNRPQPKPPVRSPVEQNTVIVTNSTKTVLPPPKLNISSVTSNNDNNSSNTPPIVPPKGSLSPRVKPNLPTPPKSNDNSPTLVKTTSPLVKNPPTTTFNNNTSNNNTTTSSPVVKSSVTANNSFKTNDSNTSSTTVTTNKTNTTTGAGNSVSSRIASMQNKLGSSINPTNGGSSTSTSNNNTNNTSGTTTATTTTNGGVKHWKQSIVTKGTGNDNSSTTTTKTTTTPTPPKKTTPVPPQKPTVENTTTIGNNSFKIKPPSTPPPTTKK
ncbi:hypothetical protein ABK040_013009 [Willaertia magna]